MPGTVHYEQVIANTVSILVGVSVLLATFDRLILKPLRRIVERVDDVTQSTNKMAQDRIVELADLTKWRDSVDSHLSSIDILNATASTLLKEVIARFDRADMRRDGKISE